MSEQTKLIPEEKKEKTFLTIRDVFEDFFDNKEIRVFQFIPYGSLTAKTAKKPCRITIAIPDDIDDTTNLKFLDNWSFLCVAIPRKVIENKNDENKKEE